MPKTKKMEAPKQANEEKMFLTDALSVVKSPMYERSYYAPYNPDDLVRKFGGNKGLDTYQKMKTDDAVKSALFLKKAAVLSSGWKIQPASQDEADIEIADFVKDNLINWYNGNFDQALLEVLSALEYGFSLSEKIYEVADGKVWLKELKNKPPQSFEFHTDDYGRLLPEGLKQWTANKGIINLPLYKFIHFVNAPEFNNLYGESDLRSAYRSWFSKDIIIKAWNIYLERCGNPLIVAKYGKTASSTDRATLQNMINNVSFKTSMLLPEEAQIEFKESIRQATGDFEKAIDKHNQMIMRSIMIPRQLGFDEASGGSYALGKINFEVFSLVIGRLRQELQESINDQLIKQMVSLNYPACGAYPQFMFNPLTEDDKSVKAKDIIEGLRAGALQMDLPTENYLRGLLGLPEIVEEERIEVKAEEKEEKDYSLRRQPNKYEKKVNFAFLQKALKDDVEEGIDEIKDQLRKIRDDYTTQIVRKRIVENKNVAGVDQVEFKYIREMAQLIEKLLRRGYESGKSSAKQTAKKANFTVSGIGLVHSKALLWIKSQAKILTGDISVDLQNKAKKILLDGLSRGAPTNEVVNLIDEAFEPYVAIAGVEGSEITAMRLYTEVNTTYAQALANGMREFNAELEKDGWLEAYEYSAILDENTTEGCEELDGKIYGVNNPYLNEIIPPRHFNCRSLLIPIFQGEEWVESEVLSVGREF